MGSYDNSKVIARAGYFVKLLIAHQIRLQMSLVIARVSEKVALVGINRFLNANDVLSSWSSTFRHAIDGIKLKLELSKNILLAVCILPNYENTLIFRGRPDVFKQKQCKMWWGLSIELINTILTRLLILVCH